MRRRGFTQADAARYLEMTEPRICVILSARYSPGLVTALHIERLTGIPVEAWASEVDEAADAEPVATGKRKVAKE